MSGRCHDCLDTLVGRTFFVLKRMRDVPADFVGDERARRQLESLCYDAVAICEDCAGWYGDDAIEHEGEL